MTKQNTIFFLFIILSSCNSNQKDLEEEDKATIIETEAIKQDSVMQIDTISEVKIIDTIKIVNFQKIDTLKDISEFVKLLKCKVSLIESVDFDGDGTKDYICKSEPIITKSDATYFEFWLNSNKKNIKKKKLFVSDCDFYKRNFINIDNDKELEIFEVELFEDGADYTVIDQNLKTGKDSIILYYNPVIIENKKYYWGYPWDSRDILIKNENGKVKIHCSLSHKIVRDGNEENDPKHQKQMPVIFFNGYHTQDSEVSEIQKNSWLPFEEIMKQIKR
jgi:hypothetical protein